MVIFKSKNIQVKIWYITLRTDVIDLDRGFSDDIGDAMINLTLVRLLSQLRTQCILDKALSAWVSSSLSFSASAQNIDTQIIINVIHFMSIIIVWRTTWIYSKLFYQCFGIKAFNTTLTLFSSTGATIDSSCIYWWLFFKKLVFREEVPTGWLLLFCILRVIILKNNLEYHW